MLGPLVTAYREWIDGEEKKLDDRAKDWTSSEPLPVSPSTTAA